MDEEVKIADESAEEAPAEMAPEPDGDAVEAAPEDEAAPAEEESEAE